MSLFGADEADAIHHSSPGRPGSLPTNAIDPFRPTDTSTKNDHAGLTSPSSSLFAGPSRGASQSEMRVPSFPPTTRALPSGVQTDAYRQRSIGFVRFTPSPPEAADVTWMSFTLFGSRSRGHQYESFVPSGEKTGKPSK